MDADRDGSQAPVTATIPMTKRGLKKQARLPGPSNFEAASGCRPYGYEQHTCTWDFVLAPIHAKRGRQGRSTLGDGNAGSVPILDGPNLEQTILDATRGNTQLPS